MATCVAPKRIRDQLGGDAADAIRIEDSDRKVAPARIVASKGFNRRKTVSRERDRETSHPRTSSGYASNISWKSGLLIIVWAVFAFPVIFVPYDATVGDSGWLFGLDEAFKGTALFNSKLPHGKVLAILEHLAEGCGVRQTARLVGVNKDTVTRLALLAGQHAKATHDELVALSPPSPRSPSR
jgi:hypothetical protein